MDWMNTCWLIKKLFDDNKIVNISRLFVLCDLLNLDNKILHEASSIEDYGPFILFYGKFKWKYFEEQSTDKEDLKIIFYRESTEMSTFWYIWYNVQGYSYFWIPYICFTFYRSTSRGQYPKYGKYSWRQSLSNI